MAELEWDDAKRQTNLAKHGVDFVEAAAVLADPSHIIVPDDRRDYGEPRYVVLGANRDGEIRVLVMTPRADRLRIISIRPANAKERGFYGQEKDHPRDRSR